jgi:MraZ protein
VGRSGAYWGIWVPSDQNMSSSDPSRIVFYTSSYSNAVDDKRRLQIPAKWRPGGADIGFTLVVWPGGAAGACLRGLPPRQMEDLMSTIETMSAADPTAVALRRLIGSKSELVSLDKGGRICLPEAMAAEAGIGRSAVLVGLLDRFEIWNPDRYEAATKADEQLSQEAFKLLS